MSSLSYIALGGSILTLLLLLVVFTIALLFVAGLHTHDKLSTSIEIDASPDEVWRTLTNFEQYPEWNPFMTRVVGKAESAEKIKVTIALPFKQSLDFNLLIDSVTPTKEMVWLGTTLEPKVLDGEHYFRIEKIEGGKTRFSQGEKFSGILLYVSWPLLKVSVTNNFNKMNEALKARVEGISVSNAAKAAEEKVHLKTGAA